MTRRYEVETGIEIVLHQSHNSDGTNAYQWKHYWITPLTVPTDDLERGWEIRFHVPEHNYYAIRAAAASLEKAAKLAYTDWRYG